MKKKLFAALLALVMVLSLLPVTALALGTGDGDDDGDDAPPTLAAVEEFFAGLKTSPLESPGSTGVTASNQQDADKMWVSDYGVTVAKTDAGKAKVEHATVTAKSVDTETDEAPGEDDDSFNALVYDVTFTAKDIRYRGNGPREGENANAAPGSLPDFGYWAGISFPIKGLGFEDTVTWYTRSNKSLEGLEEEERTGTLQSTWTAAEGAEVYNLYTDWGERLGSGVKTWLIIMKLGENGLECTVPAPTDENPNATETETIKYVVYDISVKDTVTLKTTPTFVNGEDLVPTSFYKEAAHPEKGPAIGLADDYTATLSGTAITVNTTNLQYRTVDALSDAKYTTGSEIPGWWVGVKVPEAVGYDIKTINGADVGDLAPAAEPEEPAVTVYTENIVLDGEDYVKYYNGTGGTLSVTYAPKSRDLETGGTNLDTYSEAAGTEKTVNFKVSVTNTTKTDGVITYDGGENAKIATMTTAGGVKKNLESAGSAYTTKLTPNETHAGGTVVGGTLKLGKDDMTALKAKGESFKYTLDIANIARIGLDGKALASIGNATLENDKQTEISVAPSAGQAATNLTAVKAANENNAEAIDGKAYTIEIKKGDYP